MDRRSTARGRGGAAVAGAERIAFRKLSREEYANSIRDLLGVTFDVKAPTGLPEDPDWKGFERIGSVLSLSPAHVEKYLAAAEIVLDEALSLRPEPQRELIRWTPFDMRYGGKSRPEFEARGIADQVRLDLIPNNHVSDTWPLEIKASGEYRLRIKLSGLRPAGGRAPRLKVYLSNIDKTVLEQDVDAPEDQTHHAGDARASGRGQVSGAAGERGAGTRSGRLAGRATGPAAPCSPTCATALPGNSS